MAAATLPNQRPENTGNPGIRFCYQRSLSVTTGEALVSKHPNFPSPSFILALHVLVKDSSGFCIITQKGFCHLSPAPQKAPCSASLGYDAPLGALNSPNDITIHRASRNPGRFLVLPLSHTQHWIFFFLTRLLFRTVLGSQQK